MGFLAIGFLFATRHPVSGKARLGNDTTSAETRLPFEELNRRARASRDGDPASIQSLADEAFKPAGLEIPVEAVEAMRDRLVAAEKEYRTEKGKQKAIEEHDVARMINYLADTLHLPGYARTSPRQVRHLRIGVWPYLPDFIGQEDAKERAKRDVRVGIKLTSKMSPLEAGYIAVLMLQQKATNEAFQVAPEEERLYVHRRNLERWTAHRNRKELVTNQQPTLKVQGEDNPKVKEIREAVTKGLKSLGFIELNNLPDSMLDNLGIKEKQ
jgi:hypothetical protein